MLDAEAQEMCQARRYERTEARKDCRAGFHQRKLQTQAGQVKLEVPKLRYAEFETAIIERYRRRESSTEPGFDGDVSGGGLGVEREIVLGNLREAQVLAEAHR